MVLEGAIEFWIFDIGLIISINVVYQYILYVKKVAINMWLALFIGFFIGVCSYFITTFIRDIS